MVDSTPCETPVSEFENQGYFRVTILTAIEFKEMSSV